MYVTVCDVGPRDGLQNDALVLSPELRAELCIRLADAGLPRVEAVSFVNPKLVPQMAGAEDVLRGLPARTEVAFSALVLNRKGLDRALAAGVGEVHLASPLTDEFARRNQNTTTEDAASQAAGMIEAALAAGVRPTATLAVAFGCPFEGRVDPGFVAHHAQRMAAAGAAEVMLADTVGVAFPWQVKDVLRRAVTVVGDVPVGLHLHNTRNTGYANTMAGLEAGVRLFDASVGGLGGCPFAPRASGNIATEDLVHLLQGEGVETGVDLDGLIRVAEGLSQQMGRDLPGLVYRAGAFLSDKQARKAKG